jgi:dienelactone hydrolase
MSIKYQVQGSVTRRTRNRFKEKVSGKVRIAAAALLASKIVKSATLKIYPGAPHGMCSSLKDQVNEDLLAFIKA